MMLGVMTLIGEENFVTPSDSCATKDITVKGIGVMKQSVKSKAAEAREAYEGAVIRVCTVVGIDKRFYLLADELQKGICSRGRQGLELEGVGFNFLLLRKLRTAIPFFERGSTGPSQAISHNSCN